MTQTRVHAHEDSHRREAQGLLEGGVGKNPIRFVLACSGRSQTELGYGGKSERPGGKRGRYQKPLAAGRTKTELHAWSTSQRQVGWFPGANDTLPSA